MTGRIVKPRVSGNMLPNIKIHENGWLHFSGNLRGMAIIFLELTPFALPNISIYFNFEVLRSVVMLTFLN